MVGTNDLCYNRSIEDTLTNYDEILSRLQKALPDTQIYVESVLPFNDRIFPAQCLRTNDNIENLNKGIETLAARHASQDSGEVFSLIKPQEIRDTIPVRHPLQGGDCKNQPGAGLPGCLHITGIISTAQKQHLFSIQFHD